MSVAHAIGFAVTLLLFLAMFAVAVLATTALALVPAQAPSVQSVPRFAQKFDFDLGPLNTVARDEVKGKL